MLKFVAKGNYFHDFTGKNQVFFNLYAEKNCFGGRIKGNLYKQFGESVKKEKNEGNKENFEKEENEEKNQKKTKKVNKNSFLQLSKNILDYKDFQMNFIVKINEKAVILENRMKLQDLYMKINFFKDFKGIKFGYKGKINWFNFDVKIDKM